MLQAEYRDLAAEYTRMLILSSTEVGRFMLPLWSSVGWAFRCCGSTRIHPSVEA